jgi:hypothetical protein
MEEAMARLSVSGEKEFRSVLTMNDHILTMGGSPKAKVKTIKLPSVPTHTPGEKLSISDELKMAMASDDEDDDDASSFIEDTDLNEDFNESNLENDELTSNNIRNRTNSSSSNVSKDEELNISEKSE